MTELRTYPAGVPCWIDTEQPDPQAARHFYGELFGWTFEPARREQSPGTYWVASLGGKDVAAVAESVQGEAGWNTYVAVDDVDAAAALVSSTGGRVVEKSDDDAPAGMSAVCIDPTNAPFRLWRARRRLGAQITNAPNTWNFSDLHTNDIGAAKTFYAAIFGWDSDTLDNEAGVTMWRRPGYGDHLEATIDPDIRARQAGVGAPPGFEDAIAWLAPLEPGALASHWHVTFTVDDRDGAVATAERLGGSTVSSTDTEWTKEAIVHDPQGAEFTLSEFTPA